MKRGCILYLCLLWTSLSFSHTRIMLIGDSVTEGIRSSDGLGFRDDFGLKLTEIGCSYSFVGIFGSPPYQGHFDEGAHIEQFYSGNGGDGTLGVEFDMDQNRPHIAVIHLGTNHLSEGNVMVPYSFDGGRHFATTTVAGLLANFIDYLIKWHDGERGAHLRTIFVSQIIPNAWHPGKIDEFNAEVAQLVQDANDGLLSQIPPGILRLVDQNSSFDTETMLHSDGIHPNDAGYQHMADVLYDSFSQLPFYLVRETAEEVRGAFGSLLMNPISVRVLDGHGNGSPNVDVNFQVTDGDAILVDSQPVKTDTMGFTSVQVQLGSAETSVLEASSVSLIDSIVTFQLTAVEYVRVAGVARYYFNEIPIPDVRMEWLEGGSFVDTTDGNGDFDIAHFLFGEEITLRPQKDRWSHASASLIISYDASLTARQSVGLENLSSQRRLAADVDGDGQISMNDAVTIARYAVGYTLPENIEIGEWKFMPNQFYYSSIYDDLQDQNFTGVLVGDVHGGWSVPPGLDKENGEKSWRVTLIPDGESEPFLAFHIGIEGEHMFSSDFTCRYDPEALEFLGVFKTTASQPFLLNYKNLEDGGVRMGLFSTEPFAGGDSVLSLTFGRKGDDPLSTMELGDIYINDHRLDDVSMNVRPENGSGLIDGVNLIQNVPNPFNEETVIRFQIQETSKIGLFVYNNRGQEVVSLLDEERPPGVYGVPWDGRNRLGRIVPSGIYFYRLFVDREQIVKKMVKVR